ncbi:ligand-binding protein SH3 [Stenotrophomonas muris]|uniref:ligand-binding protein SH3 n=1 Tax=Stenotrophomonas muris TaxID=2963283 RepID=UPI00065825E6|nr:ligand-binding protein SH3 [uncultured Stenotrophomonas sp.]KLN99656.1 variant SH3 domain-containing protein [Stenotrophomonas maltophilia]MBH1832040.1 ligand-binding protein SH3 [Stenotrophomonas maltophilia]
MNYIVTAAHRSEFPHPIILRRGQALVVGERYEGPEGWDDWFLCEAEGQQPGFVPAPVIGRDAQGGAFATQDYCARELDVDPGQTLRGMRTLNGWAWCVPENGEPGWVPFEKLRAIKESRA